MSDNVIPIRPPDPTADDVLRSLLGKLDDVVLVGVYKGCDTLVLASSGLTRADVNMMLDDAKVIVLDAVSGDVQPLPEPGS